MKDGVKSSLTWRCSWRIKNSPRHRLNKEITGMVFSPWELKDTRTNELLRVTPRGKNSAHPEIAKMLVPGNLCFSPIPGAGIGT